MKCAKCGTVNGRKERFCVDCGEPLTDHGTRTRTRKKAKSKTVLKIGAIAAGVLLVAALVVLVILNFPSGGGFETVDRVILPFTFDDETIYFLADGEKIDSRLDAEKIEDWNVSMDGTVAYFTVREEEDEMLYVLSGKDVLSVTENARQIIMSETGSAVAYVQEEELYIYRVDKMTTEKIASDVEQVCTISPDGKTIAYTGIDGQSYVYSDGKVVEMGEGVLVISLSDGGKYIYTVEENSEGDRCLCLHNLKGMIGIVAVGVKEKQPDQQPAPDTTPDEEAENVRADIPLFYTNKDHTQLIFQSRVKSGYKWYAVEKKGLEDDRHDLSGADILKPILSDNAQSYIRGNLMILGVDSVTDLVYSTADVDEENLKLVYLNDQWQTSTLVSKVNDVRIDEDGETIFYRKNDKLFSIAVEAGAQSRQLAEEVKSFQVRLDGKGLYYLDEYDILYYCKNGGQPQQVAEEVTTFYVTADGYVLYTDEYSLYSAKGADKQRTLVEDFRPGYVLAEADCTYYVANEDDSMTVYAANGGVKFQKLGVLLEEAK